MIMRTLTQDEVRHVSGAGGTCYTPPPPPCEEEEPRRKNNNGYGNGPESGPPTGNSGDHNPQLTGWNSGPKGPR